MSAECLFRTIPLRRRNGRRLHVGRVLVLNNRAGAGGGGGEGGGIMSVEIC